MSETQIKNIETKAIFIFRPIRSRQGSIIYTVGDLNISGNANRDNKVRIENLMSNYYEIIDENNLNNKLKEITHLFNITNLPNIDRDYTLITYDNVLYKIYTILTEIDKIIYNKAGHNFIDLIEDYKHNIQYPSQLIEYAMHKSMYRQIVVLVLYDKDHIILHRRKKNIKVDTNIDEVDYAIIHEQAKPKDSRSNKDIAEKHFLDYYPKYRFLHPFTHFGFRPPKTNQNDKDICCITYLVKTPIKKLIPEDSIIIHLDAFDPLSDIEPPKEHSIQIKSFSIIRNNLSIIKECANTMKN